MILEALVTTLSADGVLNVAPMGPLLEGPLEQGFVLRPFQTAVTFENLRRQGAGVLHVTDDVLLLARAAIGRVDPPPETFAAEAIAGRVLASACRFVEFEVRRIDTSGPRAELACEVVHSGRLRDHFGFNRAKHAVLEAAILATRTHLLPREEIVAEYRKLKVIVDKTGGPAERQALALLQAYVAEQP